MAEIKAKPQKFSKFCLRKASLDCLWLITQYYA
jgi:hypothetical protein